MVYLMVCLLEARPDLVERVRSRLAEASQDFRNDPETLEWSVQQDIDDPAKFCIVERYLSKESERNYHQANPLFQPLIQFLKESLIKPYELFTKEGA